LRVLYVASEVAPYAKTGGLADVAGSLPRALRELGVDVRVVLPRYGSVGQLAAVDLPVAHWRRHVGVHTDVGSDGHTWLVSSAELFERERLYGYPDDGERFIVFCRAVLELARAVGFQPDVIHCNDWQTGLIPVYLKALYRDDPFYRPCASLFTIHNLAYQGRFGPEVMPLAGLGWDLYHINALEFYGMVSFLKGGLVFADKLNTVSAQYARDIQTPEFGEGLEGVLRDRAEDLHGVENGIDLETWDPAKDGHIAAPYDAASLGGRRLCAAALRHECGIGDAVGPVFGVVARLTHEKGIGIIADAAGGIIAGGGNLVVLGTGDPRYMSRLQHLGEMHGGRMRVILRFDEALAHRVYAGSDFLLMPSLYEPCGLSQLIAMRYGCIPIARATGGLKDTIIDVDQRAEGTGLLFETADAAGLLGAVRRAMELFADEPALRAVQRRAMGRDSSWQRSAREYVRLYETAIRSAR